MKYVFLDESGDLGFNFNKGSTRHFSITLLSCHGSKEQDLRRIIKKVRQKILNKKMKETPEIKWNNSNEEIKKEVFERLQKIDFEVFTIVLDKTKVYEYLKAKKHKLYNYISNMIINECNVDGKMTLIVDKSKKKRSLRDDFNRYITYNFKDRPNDISISHTESKNDSGLQVLDFISGAIFNKYEFENEEYYNLIIEKITTEKEFPQASGP